MQENMSQLPVGTDGTKNKDRTEVVQSVSKRLANCEHMGLQKKRILREDEIFDPNDPKIREVRVYFQSRSELRFPNLPSSFCSPPIRT